MPWIWKTIACALGAIELVPNMPPETTSHSGQQHGYPAWLIKPAGCRFFTPIHNSLKMPWCAAQIYRSTRSGLRTTESTQPIRWHNLARRLRGALCIHGHLLTAHPSGCSGSTHPVELPKNMACPEHALTSMFSAEPPVHSLILCTGHGLPKCLISCL